MRSKSIIIVSLLLCTLLLFSACSNYTDPAKEPDPQVSQPSGGTDDTTNTDHSDDSGKLVMTLDELAQYNGQNGQPAYVAVDGVIYDVTDVPEWAGGVHKNGLKAGMDLTDEIKNDSPHGLSVLDNLPVIGALA